jgi:5-methylcytosine-specific restriction enzyme A
MTESIATLRPQRLDHVMDSAREAGIDVSAWSNFVGGPARARSNPKYCYEWSFVQDGKVVVLNLWLHDMKRRAGRIVQQHNFLEWARVAPKTNWKTRARKMNFAVATAWDDALPVRVVICDGEKRDPKNSDAVASEVAARELDRVAWAVTAYDPMTGAATITRGATPPSRRGRARSRAAWSPNELPEVAQCWEGARRQVFVNAYERDTRARRDCLRFFGYACAACDVLLADRYGDLGVEFIEVHHTRPLSKCGSGYEVDPRRDLVPVCPNCHTMLHRSDPPLTVSRLRRLMRSANLPK